MAELRGLKAAAIARRPRLPCRRRQVHVSNLADFGILVRASCLLLSPSGFSTQAALLGGQVCAAQLQACLDDEGGGGGGNGTAAPPGRGTAGGGGERRGQG
jgi:hypothetical protein